jgi:hypothetical protein
MFCIDDSMAGIADPIPLQTPPEMAEKLVYEDC